MCGDALESANVVVPSKNYLWFNPQSKSATVVPMEKSGRIGAMSNMGETTVLDTVGTISDEEAGGVSRLSRLNDKPLVCTAESVAELRRN